ncbi:MAG: SpvB/TcaC N-terminal domain-containing protein, partial [Polyangiaceae bacterium]
MPDGQQREASATATRSEKPTNSAAPQENAAPTLLLPKGGGAINGIGEKFTANPVTGTGNLTVPIAVSPGRSGFGPSLALSYDSGAGNGPFGLGWSLSLPAIARRTDKGLPRYQDAIDSDIFILSGAEDLVPTLTKDSQGNWTRQTTTRNGYLVTQYRPRVEGLFSRIERWTRESDGDTFWRSVSRSNVTTLYGRTPESRITDPANPLHIFSWLICESFDDKGNAISYEYVAEDSSNVDLSLASEHNRTPASRSANRYLKRIFYGNTAPWQSQSSVTPFVAPDFSKPRSWLFELVLDHGEGHFSVTQDSNGRELATASINGTEAWPVRQDPFSRYRSTFEVRSYRLCQRVLMFHHFQDELGVPDYLVRSTEFTYQQSPVASFISQVTQSGFVLQSDKSTYLRRSLPPVEFEYSQSKVDTSVREVDPESLENLPAGVDGLRYRWLDLDGEGLQGVLAEYNDAWYYKRNLSPLSFDFVGDQPTSSARFEALAEVSKLPGFAKASAKAPRHQFLDLAGDGQLDCVVLERPTPGFYKRTENENWEPFRALSATPNVNFNNPNLRFMDVDGDGHADILITEDDVFTWYPSLAEAGFDGGIRVPKPRDEEQGPAIVFADFTQSIFLADMSGDGLTDIVRIRNGEICYWPNLGYGQFGAKVAMNSAPWFEAADLFDARRIRLADIDGSGTIDIIYLSSQGVRLYFNQAGNGWSAEAPVIPFPRVDRLSDVQTVDLLGNGTACLVWTSSLPADARQVMRYVDLMGGQKPYLLTKSRNNLGAETRIRYAPSTKFYLQDRQAGRPWATRLPFPVHVVERVETFDWISQNHFVTRYRYHHGHYDGFEREFRGFGMIEQQDTEELGVLEASGTFQASTNIDSASYVPPVLTKTWFHTGAYPHGARVSRIYESEYYHEPSLSNAELAAMTLPDSVLPTDLETNEVREAIRSLKGAVLRTEVYALDGTDATERPYSVSEQNYTVKRIQPLDGNRHAVFFTHARESINFHYERTLYDVQNQKRADPRVTHGLVLDVDEYGNALRSAAIAYGRRFDDNDPTHALLTEDKAAQKKLLITSTESTFTNAILDADAYRTRLPAETRTYEILGIAPSSQQANATSLFTFAELFRERGPDGPDPNALLGKLELAAEHELPYEDVSAANVVQPQPCRRTIEHVRTLYRADDLNGALDLGKVGSLALPHASYKLAFTPGLLSVYARNGQALLLPDPRTVLAEGGYVRTEDVFPNDPLLGHFWIPTGQVLFSPNANDSNTQELNLAQQHFFLPQRFQDPFANSSTVTYDSHDLLLLQAEDPLHNQVTVGERVSNGTPINGNNYRVLQPARLMDPNGNRAQVAFDALGLVVGTAVLGKTTEALGDSLDSFTADLTQKQIDDFFTNPKGQAAALLQDATTRIVYDVGRFQRAWEHLSQSQQTPGSAPPSFGATIVRETHVSDLPSSGGTSTVQVSLSYSDGFGREIQRKAQA